MGVLYTHMPTIRPMSEGQDDTDGDGGRTDAGGQAQGGAQGGQPQGGGGAAGQPQGGQAAGGSQQGAYQRGPSVTDIFSIKDTMDELKLGVAVFAAVGIGVAIAAILTPLIQGAAGLSTTLVLVMGSLALGPGLGAIIALRQEGELEDQPNNLVYANTAVTAAAGTAVMAVIGGLGATVGGSIASPSFGGGGVGGGVGAGGGGLGAVLIPLIVVAIGAAITAIVTVWAIRSLLAPSPAPRPAAGAQGQPPQQ